MVRFLPVWHRRRASVRGAVLSESDPVVGTLLAVPDVWRRLLWCGRLGGILFGIMGDRFGRKPVLVATLLMIGVGTQADRRAADLCPDRLLGASTARRHARRARMGAGAEYGGAVIFLVENAPPKPSRFLLGQLCAARRLRRQSARRRCIRAW